MAASTKLGGATVVMVVLDEFTDDRFAVLQVPATDLVVLQRSGRI